MSVIDISIFLQYICHVENTVTLRSTLKEYYYMSLGLLTCYRFMNPIETHCRVVIERNKWLEAK